jgi:hypothetical protein
MKNIHRILGLAAAISLTLPACNDMLEPKPYGQQTIDATFSDFGGALNAVNGLYNPLSGGELYRGRNALLFVDYASDDVVGTDSKLTSSNYNLLDYFELPPDNQMPLDLWDGLYRVIYRANVIIERVPSLTLAAGQALNSANQPFKDQFVGEARFMRAFAYFNLVRLFGDVPLHVNPITSPSQVNIPRTPANQVYDQIIADLTEAATLLPGRQSGSGAGNEAGRPISGSAKAMLADVYLTLKQYDNARNTAQEVITGSGKRLNPTYVANFPGRGGVENSPESLFEIQFSNEGRTTGTSALGNNYGFIMGGGSETNGGSSGSLAAYRPTDNESPDNEAGFTGGLVQEYETGDLRRDVTFQRTLGSNTQQRWLTWKHHVLGTGAVGEANFPIYRLAEMYLIYAEASNELGVLDATGLDYLNQLRRRAFGLPLTSTSERDVSSGLSQAQYRDIIRSERRKELAMENKRWFDLQRYGADYANQVLKVNQGRENFSPEYLLLPIPRIELINNPRLEQNPGYAGR